MSTAPRLVTIEEYEALGDDSPYELIRGVLYEVIPARLDHALVAGRFARALVQCEDAIVPGRILVGRGGYALETNPDSVVIPDVVFMREERLPPKEARDDFVRIPPDVVVEVRSDTETQQQIERKLPVYLGAGVALVWVPDIDTETITTYTPDGQVRVYHIGEDLDGGDVLPGFRDPVTYFFE